MAADASFSLDTAWSAWSQALESSLFPAGLAPGQSFAFGQSSLTVDLVNSDPQVIHGEVFRIGDMVPGPWPALTRLGSLHQAYGFFLQQLSDPALDGARLAWSEAQRDQPNTYNMPCRQGPQVPAGRISGQEVPAPTVYWPAYDLDPGFRTRYQEWQASSVAGRTQDGGVIDVRSRARATTLLTPTRQIAVTATAGSVQGLPPFLRLGQVSPGASQGLGPKTSLVGSSQCDYQVSVAFTGLGSFLLGPGRWFNDAALRLFADQLPVGQRSAYFGDQGVLARRIYQVVLGFEPSVTLHFDDPQVSSQTAALLGQGPSMPLGVGPFQFEGAAAATAGSTDIRFGPTPSALPVLLGVVGTALSDLPVGP